MLRNVTQGLGLNTLFLGNSEGKRPLGGSGREWEDIIKNNLKERVCEDAGWIHLAQDNTQ
jgi:hypothetical protein